jgi:hypothetical protein
VFSLLLDGADIAAILRIEKKRNDSMTPNHTFQTASF